MNDTRPVMTARSLIPAKAVFKQPGSGSLPGFVDVARCEGEHGLVTVISQRSRGGMITMAVFREFERDGGRDRTTFIPVELGDEYLAHFTRSLQIAREIDGFGAVNGTPLPFPKTLVAGPTKRLGDKRRRGGRR